MFDLFSYSALGLAALALAANQAAKDSSEMAKLLPGFPLQGRWVYVPIGFFVFGAGFWALQYWPPLTTGTPGQLASHQPSHEGSAPLVVDGLPLNRLMSFFEGRTDAQAELLIGPYAGSEVTVSGQIDNVIGYSSGGGVVTFLHEGDRFDDVRLEMDGHSDILAQLNRYDQFTAKCVFQGEVDRIGVTLKDCAPISLEFKE